MKRLVSFLLLGLLAAAILGTAWFAWKNFRGIGPAVRPPSRDISTLLPNGEKGEETNPASANTTGMPLHLPDGFSISIFAKDLGKPRVMIWDPAGRLLVSIPESGKVVALPDENVDGVADRVLTVVEGLNRPHGLTTRCEGNAAVQQCTLYIAESNKVAAYDYDQGNATATNKRKIVDLPDGGNHFTRTLLFTSDGHLLISVGSSCNVCNERDWRRAKVLVVNPDGGTPHVFASGLRNSAFLALHPVTGAVWATEMGRDLLGDNLPPDEINIIEEGKDYGWPLCYGKQVVDPFGHDATRCRNTIPSLIDLQAHSAPLGLAFIPEEGWPEEWWDDLLVSYHGSWNRSAPTGYKVVRYRLDREGNLEGLEDFITGWLQSDGTALGRPVDILVQPGGILYVSDDKAGVIYRVVHRSIEGRKLK